jgi:Family of unknown function (DUF5996)
MNTQASATGADLDAWPALPLEAWRDTYATLHLWTKIVGKVRMELMGDRGARPAQPCRRWKRRSP